MANKKHAYDPETIERILEEARAPNTYQAIRDYIAAEVCPLTAYKDEAERNENIQLAFNAALAFAKRRGYLKSHHINTRLHASTWPEDKKERFRQYFLSGTSPEEMREVQLFTEDFAGFESSQNALDSFAQSLGISAEGRATRRKAIRTKRKPIVVAKGKDPFAYSPFGPTKWPAPDVIEIPRDAWEKPGKRVAYFSRLDFQAEGHRRGLLRLAVQLAAEYGMHFPVLAGGLVSHRWFAEREKQLFALATSSEDRFIAHAKLIEETVEGISSAIPEIRNPDGKLVRWYVMASPPRAYDGPYGDEILRRLERARPDIRKYRKGGERLEVKDARKIHDASGISEIEALESIYHGVVLPKAGRLPGRYMSTVAEREIADVEAQTSRDYPRLWVVGTFASALYKPAGAVGEREVPYVSIPAIRKLESDDQRIAENQSGFTVVEEMRNGDLVIYTWNFRDVIAHERDFIGMKEGAQQIHADMVDVLKREGMRTPGQIADAVGVDSETVRREILFLVEEGPSSSNLWPGLCHNEAADQYDFNKDWIRRTLRYGWPHERDEGWHEDSFISLGCMHAGYTTTDYKFLVNVIPEKMIAYNIQTLVGNGDFIAGLHHHFRDTGQVFNSTFTEQEIFAAQIIATILLKVFRARFERVLALRVKQKWSAKKAQDFVASCLPFFPFIKGNHDKWQEQEGYPALKTFLRYLKILLKKYILEIVANSALPVIDVSKIVESKVLFLDPFRPIFDLPSGLRCAVIHPEMGRAGTSLRLEKELERFGMTRYRCNVVFVANFHTAVDAHKWNPIVGQMVGVQTGATVLATDFEFHKTKEVDFGVQMLVADSYRGRIMRTTVASFGQPVMDKPYDPEKEIYEIVEELGILC